MSRQHDLSNNGDNKKKLPILRIIKKVNLV